MTDIIERVAEALWRAESMRAANRDRTEPWSEAGESVQENWRFAAKVAISEMAKHFIEIGYDLGFADSAEGWNGEYPFNRNVANCGDWFHDYLEQRDDTITAFLDEKGCGND